MFPFTCALQEGLGPTRPGGHGEWVGGNNSELKKHAVSVAVPDSADYSAVRMPDAWSRALLFEAALTRVYQAPGEQASGGAPAALRARMRDEWRGVLALLALRSHPDFAQRGRLTYITVDLDMEGMPPALRTLPSNGSDGGRTSNSVHVLKWDGQSFACTWRTTIVFTAEDYAGLVDIAPWHDGSRFEDPIRHLNASHKRLLSQWLQSLKAEWTARGRYDGIGDIVGHIRSYQTDLVGTAEVVVTEDALRPNAWDDAGMAPPYDVLSPGVLPEPPPSEESLDASPDAPANLVMKSRRDDGESRLLIDQLVAGAATRPARDIHVYGGVHLDTALERATEGSSYAMLGEMRLPEGVEWRDGSAFFTPSLVLIRGAHQFTGALKFDGIDQTDAGGQSHTAVLPIQPWVLDYIEPEDLARKARLVRIGNQDEWRCELALQVSVDGVPQQVNLAATYSTSSDTVHRHTTFPPAFQIWPNFYADDWQAYYAYCYELQTGEDSMFMRPLGDVKESGPYYTDDSRGRKWCEVSLLSSYPEALACDLWVPSEGAYVSCGIALLSKPPSAQVAKAPSTWAVGIDLGTTGTYLSYRASGGAPQPMAFEARSVQVMGPPELADYSALRFADSERSEMPFLTFFHAPPEATGHDPFLAGNILFYHLLANPVAQDDHFSMTDLHCNLKWANDPHTLKHAQMFLAQACLQANAEARAHGAGALTWHATYPTAFSGDMRGHIQLWWKAITRQISELTGCTNTPETPRPEAIASALYFAEEQSANLDLGAVCIDIGGGTSDLSFWEGRKLLNQVSCLYAGRDIFFEALRANLAVLDLLEEEGGVGDPSWYWLKSEEISKIVESRDIRVGEEGRPSFYAHADSMLQLVRGLGASTDRRLNPSWQEFLATHNAIEDVKAISQHVRFALSGLFYYVGLCVRDLRSSGYFSRGLPDFCLAGNGIRMLDWAVSGEFSNDMTAAALFRHILYDAIGSDPDERFRLILSNDPKSESSRGSTHPGTHLDVAAGHDFWPLAGETFDLGGSTQSATKYLTPEDVFGGKVEVRDGMDELHRFVGKYNEFAAGRNSGTDPVPTGVDDPYLYDEVFKNTYGRVKGLSQQVVGGDSADQIIVEPIFILEMKELLGQLLERD
ncbi:hypothetical protein HOI71_15690 [Candidatus Poribacteria bacterium]|nr:hypothetical protein [Candidatus Poribacteria bacterium]